MFVVCLKFLFIFLL